MNKISTDWIVFLEILNLFFFNKNSFDNNNKVKWIVELGGKKRLAKTNDFALQWKERVEEILIGNFLICYQIRKLINEKKKISNWKCANFFHQLFYNKIFFRINKLFYPNTKCSDVYMAKATWKEEWIPSTQILFPPTLLCFLDCCIYFCQAFWVIYSNRWLFLKSRKRGKYCGRGHQICKIAFHLPISE